MQEDRRYLSFIHVPIYNLNRAAIIDQWSQWLNYFSLNIRFLLSLHRSSSNLSPVICDAAHAMRPYEHQLEVMVEK